MRIRSRYVAVVAATGLVLVVASCDKKSPTGPGPRSGTASSGGGNLTLRAAGDRAG